MCGFGLTRREPEAATFDEDEQADADQTAGRDGISVPLADQAAK